MKGEAAMAKKKKIAGESEGVSQKAKKEKSKKEKVKELVESPSEDLLDKAQSEIVLGYREFEYNQVGTLRVHALTPKVESEADMAFAKEFNRLLLEDNNLPTISKMEEILREKGFWSDRHDQAYNEATENYRMTLLEFIGEKESENPDPEKVLKLNAKVLEARILLGQKIVERDSLFTPTLERQSEGARTKHKLLVCVTHPDGTPFWKNEEELNNDVRTDLVHQIIKDAFSFWQGYAPDFFGDLLDVLAGEPVGV